MKRGPESDLQKEPAKKSRTTPAQQEKENELLIAADKGDINKIKDLVINQNVNVNAVDFTDRTALMVAVTASNNKKTQVIEELGYLGADIHRKDVWGNTALDLAKSDVAYKEKSDVIEAINRIALKNSVFDRLPYEICSHVVSFLPAYSIKGTNSIKNVCHYWNRNAAVNKKVTIKEIVESCNEPEDVLAILNDEMLCNQMRFTEFMKVVCMHPGLASEVLKNVDLENENHLYAKEMLLTFGIYNEEMALKILKSPVFREKLSTYELRDLGRYHLSAANHILDSMLNSDQYDDYLITFGTYHITIASRILQDLQFCDKYSDSEELALVKMEHYMSEFPLADKLPENLIDLCADDMDQYVRNLPIAQQILDYQLKHDDTFNGRFLARLGAQYFPIAQQIMNNPKLWDNVDADDVYILGKAHLPIAQLVLDNKSYHIIYEGITLAKLGAAHFSIAQQILKNKELLYDFFDGEALSVLGKNHLPIAKQILNDQELRTKLTGRDLAALGECNQIIAQQIIDDQELCKKLKVDDLINLGCSHLAIAQKMMDDPVIRSNLKFHNLVSLGCCHLAIAQQMMDDPVIRSKAMCDGLVYLGRCHLQIAQQIIKDRALCDKIGTRGLEYLSIDSCLIARQVLNDSTLRTRLPDTKELAAKVKLFDIVMNCAKSLKETRQQHVSRLTVNAGAMDLEDDAPVISPSTSSPRLKR